MFQLIYESNKDRLNNIALIYFNRKIAYKELFSRIRIISSALISNGIKHGDIVIVCSANTPETIELIYALNNIGAIVDLVPVSATANDISREMVDLNVKAAFILDGMLNKMNIVNCDIPIIELSVGESAKGIAGFVMRSSLKKHKYISFEKYISGEDVEIEEIRDANLPAIILHTSGTTGAPKHAVLTNENLNAIAIQMPETGKNYRTDDIFLNMLPPSISFGIGMLHLSLFTGMCMVILLIPSVKGVASMFKKYRPTRFVFGPAVIEVIERCPNKDLSHIIDLSAGGAAISLTKEKSINNLLKKKNCNSAYLAGYGMTELSSAAALNHNNCYKYQSVGILLPLLNAKIIDTDTGEELKYGEEGELLICGPTVMNGYWGNADESDSIFEYDDEGNKWLHTGDLATFDSDGFLFITGRIKRIYTTLDDGNVYKLFPQRIEDILTKIKEIDQVGVICVEDRVRQNVPVAFVKIKNSTSVELVKQVIETTMKESAPKYYSIHEIMIVDEIPVTSSQKVDYKKLEYTYNCMIS